MQGASPFFFSPLIPRSDNSVWERRHCTTSRDGQGRGTGRYHLDKTNCQLPSRSSHRSDKTKGMCGEVCISVHTQKIWCILIFVCVSVVSKGGAAPSLPQAFQAVFFPRQRIEPFSLAYNYNAVMGKAAVIKINSQDFSSLRQGHTLPSGEKEKEKLREVGLHGWAETNGEICKEVKCHLILINPQLGGLVPR